MGDVYTCNEFLPRMGKFEKANSKTFFYKLIERLVDRRFGNPWEPNRCNSKQMSPGATRFKEQSDQTTCESLNDRPGHKTTRCV